ncbi:hypothetical protein DMENIID0001_073970 [Sergentomyia squamirostris]
MDPSDDNSNIEELIYSEEEDLAMETVEMEESIDEDSPGTITGDLLPPKSFVTIKPTTSQNHPVQLKTIIAGKGQPSVSAQMQKLMGRPVTIVSKAGSVQGSTISVGSGTKVATAVSHKIALQTPGKKIITISPAQAQQLKLMASSASPQHLTKVKGLSSSPGQKIIVKSAGASGKLSGTFIDMAGVSKHQVMVNPPTILNVAASPSARPPPALKQVTPGMNKVQVVRVINPKTKQETLQKIVFASPPKMIKTEGGGVVTAGPPPPKLVIQGKNGQCFYVASTAKANVAKYTPPSPRGPNPKPVSKIVLDKDKLKVVFPEPTILNASVSSTSKSFPVHVFTNKSSKHASTTVTNVRNFSCKPLSAEKKVEVRERVNIDKLLEGGGLGGDDDSGKRRPCNCNRSQCLKLYCECFANGEFCKDCNCKECFNDLAHEDERQKAIRLCLDRNPNAFRPKIGKFSAEDAIRRQHNKGCNCKRSGCLKNYCECYEAKISCSSNCKCFGCRNVEGYFPANAEDSGSSISGVKRSHSDADPQQATARKQACNFMTPDVVEASIQCMIAQADDCQKSSVPFLLTEKMILEEFGRCLAEIIDFSFNNDY